MPERDWLADAVPDGVSISWTIDSQIEVRDRRSKMLLLSCRFWQHWDCLTRDKKKRLVLALIKELPATVEFCPR